MIAGRATAEGTTRFRDRFEGEVAEGHFRAFGDLWLSSIGLGTYLGAADDETDSLYEEAILEALAAGCNVFDTSINYRHQRSERALGSALHRAFDRGLAARDEVFVSTKGGFLPFDRQVPSNRKRYLEEEYPSRRARRRLPLPGPEFRSGPARPQPQEPRSRDD